MVEILKQDRYNPMAVSKQVMIIYAGTFGFLDDLPVNSLKKFEDEFLKYMDKDCPAIGKEIEEKKELSADLIKKLDNIILQFKQEFQKVIKK
jgi:F-type H+-transporting ATPase subunit alpha